MASNSIPYFPEFEAYSDNASARWKRWLSRFKNMMVAMNVDDNDARQRALLLHYAGEQVYDIFETLTDTGESDDRASASFYFALVNLTKACKIPLVKYQMA